MDETTMDRRISDAVQTATSIAEIKGAIDTLKAIVEGSSTETKALIRLVEQRTAAVEAQNRSNTMTVGEVRTEVRELISQIKSEVLNELKDHTHNEDAPHNTTLGARIQALENGRNKVLGMISVGAVIMPFIAGGVFKLLGV